MTDIVERLRDPDHGGIIEYEAADEIERLREREATLQAQCGYTESINTLEIERLRAALKEAKDEIERLRAAIVLVRGIIVEGATVGFNPLDGGDWATRLFTSQATTFEALHGRRAPDHP